MNIAMNNGKHQADNWWRRRSKGQKVGVFTLGFLLIAGVALAIFIVRGGVSGTVSGASYTIEAAVVGTTTNTDCIVALTDPTSPDVTIDWPGAVPDDTCRVQVGYAADASNTGDLQLQAFDAPAGLKVTFIEGMCGFTLSPGTSNGIVTAHIEYDGSVANVDFDAALHGFQWVRPSEFVAGNCTPLAS